MRPGGTGTPSPSASIGAPSSSIHQEYRPGWSRSTSRAGQLAALICAAFVSSALNAKSTSRVSLYGNDGQIHEVHYRWERAEQPAYTVRLWRLRRKTATQQHGRHLH